jgi:hypothetical protein
VLVAVERDRTGDCPSAEAVSHGHVTIRTSSRRRCRRAAIPPLLCFGSVTGFRAVTYWELTSSERLGPPGAFGSSGNAMTHSVLAPRAGTHGASRQIVAVVHRANGG